MVSSAIGSMGGDDVACVGAGLVGEDGRAMRSSTSKMDGQGAGKKNTHQISSSNGLSVQ